MRDTLKMLSKEVLILFALASLFLAIGLGAIYTDRSTPTLPMSYQLSNGKVVTCKDIDSFNCGMKFTECEDGNTYRCQTNVIQLTK